MLSAGVLRAPASKPRAAADIVLPATLADAQNTLR